MTVTLSNAILYYIKQIQWILPISVKHSVKSDFLKVSSTESHLVWRSNQLGAYSRDFKGKGRGWSEKEGEE